jgi:hypothetical protein
MTSFSDSVEGRRLASKIRRSLKNIKNYNRKSIFYPMAKWRRLAYILPPRAKRNCTACCAENEIVVI